MEGKLALTAEQSLDSVLLMTVMDASWKKNKRSSSISVTFGMEFSADKTKLMTANTKGVNLHTKNDSKKLRTL